MMRLRADILDIRPWALLRRSCADSGCSGLPRDRQLAFSWRGIDRE
jgi:hypothetical protein